LPELEKKSDKPFQKLMETIREVVDCDVCSLWRINTPKDSRKDRRFRFVSLIERELKADLKDKAEHLLGDKECYVHKYPDSFTATALEELKKTRASYYYCHGQENIKKTGNTCQKLVVECEIEHIVGIPVKYKTKEHGKEETIILKLYFKEHSGRKLLSKKNDLLDRFSKIVSPYISYYYHQVSTQDRLFLLDDLMREYRKSENINLSSLFSKFIGKDKNDKDGIFQKYFQYDGASFFVWDDLNNYYKLCATTGLEWANGQAVEIGDYHKIYYMRGEGYTGGCADTETQNFKAELVICDKFKHNITDKPFEVNGGKTMMLVPISSPTNMKEVIGILRFVNKQHAEKNDVLDYFNNTDEKLFENVAPYLALIIRSFLDEDRNIRLFARLTHEAKTPSQTISLDIQTIIDETIAKDYNDGTEIANIDKKFEHMFISCCRSIEKAATVLKQQSVSNFLYSNIADKIHRPPFHKLYPRIRKISVRNLLWESKQIVIPIVKAAGVRFDKIIINGPDVSLFLDRTAFQVVFYNLLTNAIKYRNPDSKDSFGVLMVVQDKEEHCAISVADSGIGIDEKQKENIFIAGNRGGIESDNVQGLGLGLHMAKIIVEDFGGKIYVLKTKSPTAITIELPITLKYSPPEGG